MWLLLRERQHPSPHIMAARGARQQKCQALGSCRRGKIWVKDSFRVFMVGFEGFLGIPLPMLGK